MAEALPQLAPAVAAAPSSKFRMAGAKIPRESHRYSGLTSIHANISVVEPKPPNDPDSALAYSMEGSPNQPPGALQPFFWSPGWNSIQAVNKFQSEIGGALTRRRSRSSFVRAVAQRRVLHLNPRCLRAARGAVADLTDRTHFRLRRTELPIAGGCLAGPRSVPGPQRRRRRQPPHGRTGRRS